MCVCRRVEGVEVITYNRRKIKVSELWPQDLGSFFFSPYIEAETPLNPLHLYKQTKITKITNVGGI